MIGLARSSRLIVSCAVLPQRSLEAMQGFADQLPAASRYCSDGLAIYPELVYPQGGQHVARGGQGRDAYSRVHEC